MNESRISWKKAKVTQNDVHVQHVIQDDVVFFLLADKKTKHESGFQFDPTFCETKIHRRQLVSSYTSELISKEEIFSWRSDN